VSSLYALRVETEGGVADLGRVVGVLALYDLTPLEMAVRSAGSGLRIDIQLRGQARTCELCCSRLSAIVAVSVADLTSKTQ